MNRISCLTLFALLAGCAATPHYDARFGDAVRKARVAMTIDPNASSNRDPAAGIDGQSGREAVTRYHDSFKTPPPVVNVINVSGAGSSSK